VVRGPGIDVGYSLSGSLLIGDVRYTFRPNRSNVYGLVGGAFMQRGGDAWSDILPGTEFEKSNPAGIVGIGLRASGSARFQIDATAEFFLYSVDKVTSDRLVNGPFESKAFQSDLMFTVGFPLSFARRYPNEDRRAPRASSFGRGKRAGSTPDRGEVHVQAL
jgi:hypothetical protein